MKGTTITAIFGALATAASARVIILGTHHHGFGGGDSAATWISGDEPCNIALDLVEGDASPCGKHFGPIGGGVRDVHFEGCGGDL
jgi:hypothetical protein